MIIRSSNYINEDMRLQPGDKFLVSIKNHVSEIDNSEKLNGYWLTVEEVDEHSQNIKTMENENIPPTSTMRKRMRKSNAKPTISLAAGFAGLIWRPLMSKKCLSDSRAILSSKKTVRCPNCRRKRL